MNEIIITSLVLILVIIAIVSGKIPMIVVGLTIPLVLSIAGIVPASTAFEGIGSKTTFLIIGALVIGDACSRTGLTNLISIHVVRYTRRFSSEPIKLSIICFLAATMSAFLSSFGVQVALMSVIIVMSQSLSISRSKSMLALGYSTSLGGIWSISGTTITLMAKATVEKLIPGETIGMFELSIASIPIGLIIILIFCFCTARFQPSRDSDKGEKQNKDYIEPKTYSRRDCTIVAITFLLFVIFVALDGKTPLPSNMVTVCVLLIFGATGISQTNDIVNAIPWDVILFIVGITVLSDALATSGLSDILGNLILQVIGRNVNPYLILSVLCIVCAFLTQLMSNSGSFGIVLPFLPIVATSLSISLKSLIIASVISCTYGFCLPISAPSYALLAKEGNLQIIDWLKNGLPLVIIANILTVLIVPIIWPLTI